MNNFTLNILSKGSLRKVSCLLLFLLIQFPVMVAIGKPADHVEVRRIPDFNFGKWTNAGSVSMTKLRCISSANDSSARPRRNGEKMPYQVKVDSLGAGGDFYIYLDGLTNNTGNKRIRLSISHRDVNDGGLTEQLIYNNFDSHSHIGSFKRCRSDGNNSEVRISISSSELGNKVSGTYQGSFRLTAIGGSSGSATDSATFGVSIKVQASSKVQISALDNLILGSHSGVGAIYAEENFCVYSDTTSGSYAMSVSSSNQSGGSFFLNGSAGQGQIPYALYFSDQATGPGSTSVGNNTLSGFGNSNDQFCNGSNNATLSVSITETDLQAASSGRYQDTLIILVEPQ